LCDGNNTGVQNSVGTISVTNGSTTVSGSGTTFNGGGAPLSAGQFIRIDNTYLQIASVTNATTLVLTQAWRGRTLSGLKFTAHSMFSNIVFDNMSIVSDGNTSALSFNAVRLLRIENVNVSGGAPNLEMINCGSVICRGCVFENASGTENVSLFNSALVSCVNTSVINGTGVGVVSSSIPEYSRGTASQSGTTLTGSAGAYFNTNMVGGRIVFASGVQATISAFVSPTNLTVSPSQTVTTQAYRIYYRTPTYSVGTASQSGTTITGVGTSFQAYMVGSLIVFANGTTANVLSVNSATSLTVSPSQTVANQAYNLFFSTGCESNKIEYSQILNNSGSGLDFRNLNNLSTVATSYVSDNNASGVTGGVLSTFLVFDSNIISNNASNGVALEGADCQITNNQVLRNGGVGASIGIRGIMSSNFFVENTGNNISIPGGSTDCSVNSNNMINGAIGILCQGSRATVNSNRISTTTSHGIQLLNVSDSSAEGNSISGCSGFGILVSGTSANNTINANRVGANTSGGIRLDSSSVSDTIVVGNNMRGNTGPNYTNSGSLTTSSLNKS
jgi:hypothetical protein